MSIQLRHQQIIKILQEEGSADVNKLANRLSVTGATIRADLRKLESQGYLQRYHGGAMLTEEGQSQDSLVETRKRNIARYAASLLRDGDSVLFDASTTVRHMVKFMYHLHDLTLFTNGIGLAKELVKNSSNKVVLIGGVLQPDGDLVKGLRGFSITDGLNIGKTFISCSGFTFKNGLSTFDVEEAEVMRERIAVAGQVIALIDSSKFGTSGVAPFATLNEVAMVITDEGIDAEAIEQFRRSGTELVVVNEHGVSNYVRRQRDYFTIGFANLDNSGFAADVLASLEAAAEKQNIRLIVKNNQLNSELALKNADDLLDEGIDLMIEYHIDERIGGVIMDKFNRHRVPVICIDIPMIGATYFGVDNYNAGLMAGEALGEWIMEHWGGHYDRILILEEPRGGTLTASRIYGQIDGLQKILGKITDGKRIYLNSGNRIDVSKSSVMETLRAYPEFHRLAILPFNDDAAIGACRAARELNREKDIIIVGQGASPITRAELRNQDSRVMGSTAFWPEQYGEKVIDIAKRILDGQRVPNAVTMQHTFLTAKNINQFYPEG
ncbi:MAG: substrate-binding domain-containing protein [Anaerolineae bacterium]|nr:substrate-binding domain-containing protein [Anaerolineae bacterium]